MYICISLFAAIEYKQFKLNTNLMTDNYLKTKTKTLTNTLKHFEAQAVCPRHRKKKIARSFA